MSTTIDQNVVEMRFDNSHFEKNVSQSMSTLDKFKQKLNFSGATKGIEQVGTATEALSVKVSHAYAAMQAQIVRWSTSISQSIEGAIKQLTTAPITTGFSEYETQINATQTILANTQSKGSTIDDVNRALEELNKYADMTIYNFTEMTRNIGTFTAAGVDLETSVNAIQGIANLAAISGSTSQQASTAMYQLSQALSTGTVRLMDWNSVVNAGMGGEVFQNALKKTSEELGTGAEAAIKASGSFRESLQDGWLTAEVLTATLKKFTSSGANEYVAEYTGLSVEAVEAALKSAEAQYGEADAIEEASKALAEKSGKNKQEIKEALEFAKNATDAATKVKTLTQLWDVMKEAAQSGWAQTWKLIVGDFEQAKDLFTPLADFFTGVINGMSDARNKLLQSALGMGVTKLIDGLNKTIEPVKEVTEAVSDMGEMVDKVIRGDFGNGEERFNALTEAGYNYYKIQNAVNEKLGDSFRYTDEQVKSQEKLAEGQEKTTVSLSKLSDEQKKALINLAAMTDSQLKSADLTQEQIDGLRELQATAEKLGIPFKEFIMNLDEINGRWLMIKGFENIGKSIIAVFKSIGDAWQAVFPPRSIEERAESLFNMLGAFHKFSVELRNGIGDAEKFKRTFQGIFAALDIVLTVVGGPLKIAFKVLGQLLSYFNLDILDVTANIGDAIVKFRDWIDSTLDFTKVFDTIIPYITRAADAIRDWWNTLKALSDPKEIANHIVNGFKGIGTFIMGIVDDIKSALNKGFDGAGTDFIMGFVNGIWDGIKLVVDVVMELGRMALEKFRISLDERSPSKTTHEYGVNFILGFWNGLVEFAKKVWDWIKDFGQKCPDYLGEVDWGQVLAVGIAVGIFALINKIANVVKAFAAPLEGMGNMLSGIGEMFEGLGESFKASAWKKKAQSVLIMALAIGVLAFAVYKLAELDTGKLWGAIGAVAVLLLMVAAIGGLLLALDFLSGKMNLVGGFGMKQAIGMVSIATALLVMAAALSLLSNIDGAKLESAIPTMLIMLAGLAAVALAISALGKVETSLTKVGGMLLKLSIALAILVGVIKLINLLSEAEIEKGIGVIATLGAMFVALIAVSSLAGENASKAGGMLLKMSIAFLAMVGVVKVAAMLDDNEVYRGLAVVTAVGVLFTALIAVSALAGANASKAGGMLLSMSLALLVVIGAIKLISGMDDASLERGLKVVAVLEVLFVALIAVSKLAGEHAVKAGVMLLLISGALLILTGIIFIISQMKPDGLERAVGIVAVLELLFIGLIAATKNIPEKCVGALVVLLVAIGLIAGIITGLTFLDSQKLYGATAAFAILIGTFAMLINFTKTANDIKIKPILIMLGVLTVLAGVMHLLGGLDPASALTGAAGVSLMAIALATALTIMAKAGKMSKTVGNYILPMTIAVAGMGVVLALMSACDTQNAITNAVALSILMNALASALAIMGAAGRISTTVSKQLGPMLAVVAGMALILGIMSGLNVEASIPTAIALGILMNSFASALAIMGAAGRISTTITKNLLPMVAVVAGLALILGIMSALDIEASIPNAISLSILLIAFSGALAILSVIGPMAVAADAAIIGLAKLVAALVIIVGVLGGLSKIPGFNELLADGGATLMLVGKALGGLIGGIIGGIGEGITSSLPTMIEDIKEFISGLSEVATIASGIEASSFDGVSGLVKAMLGISIGSLVEHFTSLITGESSMESFTKSASEFVDAIVTISTKLSEVTINDEAVQTVAKCGLMFAELNKALPKTGGIAQDLAGEQDLAAFGKACVAFAGAMIVINDAVSAEGFTVQSERISLLVTAGERFNELNAALPRTGGIAQDLAGEQDLGRFGLACKAFAAAMIEVNDAVSAEGFTIQSERIAALVTAGEQFNELNTALPKTGGLAQDLAGEKDLSAFGTSAKAFAAAMLEVGNAVSGDDFTLDLTTIDTLKEAGLKFNELQNALPTTGGWWEEIAGEKDISDFGTKIQAFGEAMAAYSTSVSELDTASIMTSITTAYLIKSLVESLTDLDASGLDSFAGVGLGDGHVVNLGQAMAKYGEEVADLNVEAVSTSVTAATKLKSLIEGLAGLDATGIENFKVGSIGTAMQTYSDKVKDLDGGVVSQSISAANRLKTFIASLVGLDPSGIANFKLGTIGATMKKYGGSVAGLNMTAIMSSISAANQLKTFIGSLSGLSTDGVSSFTTAIDELSTVEIDKIVKAFSGAAGKLSTAGADMMLGLVKGITTKITAVTNAMSRALKSVNDEIASKMPAFERAGGAMITKMAGGLSSKKGALKGAVTSAISKATSGIKASYDTFHSAGSYLGSGLVLGIGAKKQAAYDAGYALGQAAAQGEKDGQQSKSPSKLTYQAGIWLGEGLIGGMQAMGKKVYDSGYDMGDRAATSISNTVARIADMVNSDIDAQPTISPVLDLSNVQTGINAIGSMFGDSSLGVSANISAINSMMNRNGQNGRNGDIVSAIDKLNKKMDSIGNTTYQINGVTYDDGSNVATAIQAITRAALRERRV